MAVSLSRSFMLCLTTSLGALGGCSRDADTEVVLARLFARRRAISAARTFDYIAVPDGKQRRGTGPIFTSPVERPESNRVLGAVLEPVGPPRAIEATEQIRPSACASGSPACSEWRSNRKRPIPRCRRYIRAS